MNLRFNQDTTNEQYKKDREYCDELTPKLIDLDVRIKRLLLAHPRRAELEQKFGPQAFALWEADVMSFDPAIEDAPGARGQAAGRIQRADRRGQALVPRPDVQPLGDRQVPRRRRPADAPRCGAGPLAMVCRQSAAARPDLRRPRASCGTTWPASSSTSDYIELGYKRMKRVDYNQADVEQFRAEVREHLVPLAVELRKKQAAALGVDKLMFWDDAIHDRAGNPAPHGEHDWMVARATEMFDSDGAGPRRLLPPDGPGRSSPTSRTATAKPAAASARRFPATACRSSSPTSTAPSTTSRSSRTKWGTPIRRYQSRQQPLLDYLWPTYESCEIHSMGLEFLTWPHMEKFFEGDAERFRRIHLTQGLLFIPYGVAVDHFQHLVYARPEATPAERHAMWQEMERTYLPWRDYGDLPHVPGGGFWQFQRHIYLSPFYYIDYTLAQTCALQLWVRSQKDPAGTLAAYNALCCPRRRSAVPGTGPLGRPRQPLPTRLPARRGRAGESGAGVVRSRVLRRQHR